MLYGIIYKVTNNVNGKCYIGQTKSVLSNRKSSHKNDALKRNSGSFFHKAIRKYGWDNFKWDIIYSSFDREDLNIKEIMFIEIFNSYVKQGIGYNLTKGGDYNPMSEPDIRERQRNSLLISMKKYSGENNVMNRPDVKEYHFQKIQELTKTDKWKELKAKGDNKQKSTYEIIKPNGEKIIITGLNAFCKENNLSQSKMSLVVSGKRPHHKGYKCKRLSIGKPIGYNIPSNKYKIKTPYNDILIVDNLSKYCDENNLAYISMLAVSKGRQRQHKGYICELLED